jgi:putative phage-type endonuclease
MPIINREFEQGTPEWVSARIGRPTASNASRLITSTGAASESMRAYAEEMAGDVVAGEAVNQWSGNGYTEYGHEMEEEARLAYELRTGHEVEQVAFIEDDLQRCLASPDGIVGDNGLVEIKNLPKKHIAALLYYEKNGTIPTDYRAQLQMQLLVSGRDWVDMFYYSQKLPSLLVRIEPDPKLQAALKEQINAVIIERDRIVEILRNMQ